MSFDSNFVRVVGGAVHFYEDYTCTNLYVQRLLGGGVNTITITNDSATDTAQISWDGATLEGDIRPGESMTFNCNTKTSVYLKGTAGGDHVRVWGW